ncbi:MAG: ABC transporter permease [Acetobacteraceae bacterium]
MAASGHGRTAIAADPVRNGVLVVLWALLALFVLYPLAALAVRALSAGGHLALGPALGVLRQRDTWRAFFDSLELASLVGLLGTAAGFLFAFTVERSGLGRIWRRVLDIGTLLPLISPPFTTSIAFIFSFGPRGFITHDLLGMGNVNVYGLWSTLLAESLTYFPLAYLALRPMLGGIDASLEEMAFSLGSSRWRVFRTVVLPLTVPGLGNAFLLLFAASLADFATPLILAGNSLPVLPTEAYLQITGLFDLRGGAVLSLLLLLPAVTVYLLQRRWIARRSYVTVTGRAGHAALHRPPPALVRAVLLLACLVVVVLIAYLYLLLAYASFVFAFGANYTLTLRHYHVIFTEGLPAIRDTLIIAAIATPLGGFYGVLVGTLVSRSRSRLSQAMEMVSMINYALPGTIVGIAYLIAFNDPPLALTGTALIIIVCYTFRYSPSGIRTTVALLQQIDRGIEEASSSLGAGSFTTFRRITVPLVLPALFAGLGVMFIRSMTAISATIFLVSIHWTLITVRILENMTELSLGPAAAFSVFVIAVVLVVLGGMSLLLRGLGGVRAGMGAAGSHG